MKLRIKYKKKEVIIINVQLANENYFIKFYFLFKLTFSIKVDAISLLPNTCRIIILQSRNASTYLQGKL